MSYHIDYNDISWEQFEDICLDLWFDGGYTNIKPMGRRKEGGRDAIFVDSETKNLTIFQFKCWATKYETSKLKSMIKKAAQKIAKFGPQKFILNSAHAPVAAVNDWIEVLENEMGFSVEYWDRSWIDLRLDNQRQDLRFEYFKIALAHHSWQSLVSTSTSQVRRAITSLSRKYIKDIFVKRQAEEKLLEFTESDSIVLAMVDRSGRGKTNLICKIAEEFYEKGRIVVHVRADTTLSDDNSLERLVINALGYDVSDFQVHFNDVSKLLKREGAFCYVFLDGISEADDLTRANRSLRNLILRLVELGCFKLMFTCRDISWTQIGYALPMEHFYLSEPSSESSLAHSSDMKFLGRGRSDRYELLIDDFSDEELTAALPLYQRHFEVAFTPSGNAMEQLKHPLLLRFFCESHSGQTLGKISAIPVAQTFETYLEIKAEAIEYRSDRHYSKASIYNLLRNIAGQMWKLDDTSVLFEEHWGLLLPDFTQTERDRLFLLLAEEGVVRIDEEPILFTRKLSILFDKLREYLLLQHLLSNMPRNILEAGIVTKIAIAALKNFQAESNPPEGFKFLSLIGIILPDVSKRRRFLQLLLNWDFQTYCECVANISPVGKLSLCNYQSLESVARELRRWYRDITRLSFSDETYSLVDPWEWVSPKNKTIGIKLSASPECKEISYGYTAEKIGQKPKNLVSIKLLPDYPTFEISIGTDKERIKLHDPDNGFLIPIWRRSQDDFNEFTRRTINYTFSPRFQGDSLNIPERMGLYDVLNEIEHLLKNMESSFPLIPTPIAEETENGETEISLSEFDDEKLYDFLNNLFINAISSYMMLVDRYFSNFKKVLNLSAQMPCRFLFATNSSSVRYAFVPVETEDEMQISHRILDPSIDISDPNLQITITDDEVDDAKPVLIKDFVLQELSRMGKMRPPLHPIDLVESIENFKGDKPIKNLVYRWLISDFHSVFGF